MEMLSSSQMTKNCLCSAFLPSNIFGKVRTSQKRMVAFSVHLLFLVILSVSWSPSASAFQDPPCTPTFDLEEDYYNAGPTSYMSSSEEDSGTKVVVEEGSRFALSCLLDKFHFVKWTLNGKEISYEDQERMGIEIRVDKAHPRTKLTNTRLTVFNASSLLHDGEYKCTPICKSNEKGANEGVKITVNIAINVTVNYDETEKDLHGTTIYKKFVYSQKRVELICSAPDADQLKWYRLVPGDKQDMDDVCIGEDPLETRNHDPHCTIERRKTDDQHELVLSFLRIRKHANATFKTISDFRKYRCVVTSSTRQGSVEVELAVNDDENERLKRSSQSEDESSPEAEVISVRRKLEKGERSLSVTQGDAFQIYCDVTGVAEADLKAKKARVVWTKDGETLTFEGEEGVKELKGDVFRQGFEIKQAAPEHRGMYACRLERDGFQITPNNTRDPEDDPFVFEYYVRVKDKLGALWPFLAICGEVVVLSTLILIFEHRKGKPDMDESETEGSPEH